MDRVTKPYNEVKTLLADSISAFELLVGHIRFHYVMDELWEPGNPTHKHYNNLRFRRGGKTLITLCLREGYFIACVVLGKDEREKFEAQRESFSAEVCKEYDAAEVYHDGKWLGFEVRDDALTSDLTRLLQIKRKHNRKMLPDDIDSCGRLCIGLSHDEITSHLLP